MKDILRRVEMGDFSGLERVLDSLADEDESYAAFCGRIREYAKAYDDEAIINFISNYSTTKPQRHKGKE